MRGIYSPLLTNVFSAAGHSYLKLTNIHHAPESEYWIEMLQNNQMSNCFSPSPHPRPSLSSPSGLALIDTAHNGFTAFCLQLRLYLYYFASFCR